MTRAFGLDLAGYSGTRSAFAEATNKGAKINATIFSCTCFSTSAEGNQCLGTVAAPSIALLKACVTAACLVVDVPIDLQLLPTPLSPKWLWELAERPVDHAFDAMPPLASLLGACVARFAHLGRAAGTNSQLGTTLFET